MASATTSISSRPAALRDVKAARIGALRQQVSVAPAAASAAPVADEAVDYEALARDLEGASPLEILDRALAMFGSEIAIAFRICAFFSRGCSPKMVDVIMIRSVNAASEHHLQVQVSSGGGGHVCLLDKAEVSLLFL